MERVEQVEGKEEGGYMNFEFAHGRIFVVVREVIKVGAAVEIVAAAPLHREITGIQSDANGINVKLRAQPSFCFFRRLFHRLAPSVFNHAFILRSGI